MTDAGWWPLVLLLAAGTLVLGLLHRRHLAGVRSERRKLFETCKTLLDDATLVERGLDFPVLIGRWRGRDIRLEPVVDTLSMRTLPVLWLVVTIRRHNEGPGRLSVLARECGTEFYARHHEVGKPVAGGDNWPRDLSLRLDEWGSSKPGEEVLQRIRAVMTDRSVKQMVITPEATRLVWRCATALSSTYRVTRRVDLDNARVDAGALGEVLDATSDVVQLIDRPVADSEQAAR